MKERGVPLYRETPKKRVKKTAIYLGVLYAFYFYYLLHLSNFANEYFPVTTKELSFAFSELKENPFNLSFNINIIGKFSAVYLFISLIILVYVYSKPTKIRTKEGEEHGSSRWLTNLKEFNKKYNYPYESSFYEEKPGTENIILSQSIRLGLNGHETKRNANVLVIGGAGTGKSRFFIKPNLLQMNSSYVVTDPSGELFQSTAKTLKSNGYKIKILNLNDMKLSFKYNPFHYIRDDLGVYMMIDTFIKNTDGKSKHSGDPFWDKAEKMFLSSLAFYLVENYDEKYQNFSNVNLLTQYALPQESGEPTLLDKLFEEVEKNIKEKGTYSIALENYKSYKSGAKDTARSIVISAQTRLFPFTMPTIRDLTSNDTLNLEKISQERTILYCILPTASTTYNFLSAMMFSQLFEMLYHQAESKKNKMLDEMVQFEFDEFANVGVIPNFDNLLATMRKYRISSNIILQNLSQLEAMYKDTYKSIIGNCDSQLFLGSSDGDTLKWISTNLDSTTITVSNITKGKNGSVSESKTKRELMTISELKTMNNDDCIVQIRGIDPYYGKKYSLESHPLYKQTGDYSDKYLYDLEDLFKEENCLLVEEIEKIKEKSRNIFKNNNLDVKEKTEFYFSDNFSPKIIFQ